MSTSRVFTVGQVLTAAQVNDLPQGVLGKAIVTADSAAISTVETDLITAPAVSIAGSTRRIKISFHVRNLNLSVPGDQFTSSIKEGATVLQQSITAGSGHDSFVILDSPAAGSHTYKVSLVRFSGTGTAVATAGTDHPMTILVEDVGQ